MRKYMKVKKQKDTAFSRVHPNGIDEDYTSEGVIDTFEIGESLFLIRYSKAEKLRDIATGYFKTSKVVKINKKTFETENSVYEYEITKK